MARPDFAHAAEKEVADLLSFYRIHWMYEPHVFPVEWDAGGHVAKWFRPDFYLPDWDLYIEVTTMPDGNCATKHRKIRRLQELYPGIRVKLLGKEDIRALLLRSGRPERVGQIMGPNGNLH